MSRCGKCCLWLLRVLINLLIAGLLAGAAYLIYFVQTVSSRVRRASANTPIAHSGACANFND